MRKTSPIPPRFFVFDRKRSTIIESPSNFYFLFYFFLFLFYFWDHRTSFTCNETVLLGLGRGWIEKFVVNLMKCSTLIKKKCDLLISHKKWTTIIRCVCVCDRHHILRLSSVGTRGRVENYKTDAVFSRCDWRLVIVNFTWSSEKYVIRSSIT